MILTIIITLYLLNQNFYTPLNLNYNNKSFESPNCNYSKAVTKFSPPKEKGPSSSELSVPSKSGETASSVFAKSAVQPESVLANADSGATGTYLRLLMSTGRENVITTRPNHRCGC